MSGKYKYKGKRKDKIKPKPHEIELFNKYIDLKRFAYDVIKYTALRFRVPESCIALWKDKCNNYERDDFFFLICMRIVQHQITQRGRCHVYFCGHYEENKLVTPRDISELLYAAIEKVTVGFRISPLKIVEVSLAIACELFLFLYSKDMDLNPKKLAFNWFECYLNTNKKDFQYAGGFKEIYRITSKRKCEIMDSLLNKFIDDYCLPYETSANNPSLDLIFNIYMDDSLPPNEKENMLNQLTTLEDLADRLTGLKIIEPPATEAATGVEPPATEAATGVEPPAAEAATGIEPPAAEAATGIEPPAAVGATGIEPPAAKEATGSSLPESTVDQVSQLCSSFAESPKGQPWFHGTLSAEERTKRIWSKIRQFSLDSSGTRQSRGPTPSASIAPAPGPAQSYKDQGARPKDRA